jgi:hypothetical protein
VLRSAPSRRLAACQGGPPREHRGVDAPAGLRFDGGHSQGGGTAAASAAASAARRCSRERAARTG